MLHDKDIQNYNIMMLLYYFSMMQQIHLKRSYRIEIYFWLKREFRNYLNINASSSRP